MVNILFVSLIALCVALSSAQPTIVFNETSQSLVLGAVDVGSLASEVTDNSALLAQVDTLAQELATTTQELNALFEVHNTLLNRVVGPRWLVEDNFVCPALKPHTVATWPRM